ncbi:hypothetical protein N0V90_004942 [Kalmusia sp. IMI 367209]|nr:hypothetical protein N0V90_004942 [Kalmusia sp. IMI 367209]
MKLFRAAQAWTALTLLAANLCSLPASAIDLDPTSPDSVRSAAKDVAQVLWSMYATTDDKVISGITGLLTYPPYYWWQAGAMFGQLIDYWYYTNDSSYNDMIRDGLIHQAGDKWDYMPANQSKDEGNDDQLFWAFTLMSAAEYNFPNPPDGTPGWLGLSQSIWNQLATRWEAATCGGGVRWQIYQWLPGWNYKNLASNGGYFQLSARLALFTGNETYAKRAEEIFDWLENTSPLVTKDYDVYDGADTGLNCTKADHNQWTYNYGIMIGGAAYMYNYTNGSEIWAQRLTGFINKTSIFFPSQNNGIMTEPCEGPQNCNGDMVSFKGYLARWFAVSVQLAPFTAPTIMPHLQKSGIAAAQSCVGPSESSSLQYECGNRWYWNGYDGKSGVGQQLAALSIISANMVQHSKAPLTSNSGGTSKGDPTLGTGQDEGIPTLESVVATTADKAGAAILTILMTVATVGGGYWLIM